MNTKMKMRMLSLLLCFVMLVGLMPTTAFAADNQKVTSVAITYDASKVTVTTKATGEQVSNALVSATQTSAGEQASVNPIYVYLVKKDGGSYTSLQESTDPLSTTDEHYLCFYVNEASGYEWDEDNLPSVTVNGAPVAAEQVKWRYNKNGIVVYFPVTTTEDNFVFSVAVTTDSPFTAELGGTKQFTARVVGSVETVTWSVTGSTSSNTTIDSTGKLTVGSDETATSVSVLATSTFDSTKRGSRVISIVPKLSIDEVAVDPATATVYKGDSKTFSANVTQSGGVPTAVTWSVIGNSSSNTTIDSTGKLTVGKDETATGITVRATSTFDDTKCGESTVTLLEKSKVTQVAITYNASQVPVSTSLTGKQVTTALVLATQESAGEQAIVNRSSNETCLMKKDGDEYTRQNNSNDLLSKTGEYYFRFYVNEASGYEWNVDNLPSVTVNGTPVGTEQVKWGYQSSTGYIAVYIPVSVDEPSTYTITAVSEDTSKGTVTGGGDYAEGASVTLTATANEGYKFTGWYEGDDKKSESKSYTFTVSEACTFEARFNMLVTVANAVIEAPVEYGNPDMIPEASDSGKYTVTLDKWYDGSYNEMSAGDTFEGGKEYVLRVVFEAKEGYEFDDAVVFTVNNKATTNYGGEGFQREILFEIPAAASYPVTIENGKINGGTSSGNYGPGSIVAIVANAPESGKRFKEWTATDGVFFADATAAETSFTMPAKPVTITATYEDILAPTEYTITVENGTASVGAGTPVDKATAGTEITLTVDESAIPAGKVFDKWEVVSGGVTVTDGKFTMPANAVEIKATYKDAPVVPVTYTVTFDANGGTGTMAPSIGVSGEYTLPANEFNAPNGKQFKAWSVGGVEKAEGATITVNANTTVTAIWETIPAGRTCDIKPVTKVEPSCTEGGKEAYYKCEGCGKFYEDALGAKEITDLAAWGNIAKNGHTESDWKSDKDNHWKECTVAACGVIIENSKAAHADANNDGKCDTCEYNVGTTTTDPGNKPSDDTTKPEETNKPSDDVQSPQTGDNSMMWLWVALLFVSGFGVVATTVIGKKKSSAK